MGFLDQVITGKQPKPRMTLLYGTEGIGKSTFASQWDDPIFISTEMGLDDIDCQRFPEATSFNEVTGQMVELVTQKHDFKTLVIDSVEGLENLVFQHVCNIHNKESIDDFGYGTGKTKAFDHWVELFKGLTKINEKMHVILVGHAKIERFESPETDSFDRYTLRADKQIVPLIMERCTEVLFACLEAITRQEDLGFGKKKTKAVGEGSRVLKTIAQPAFRAKNRLELPAKMPLDYSVYKTYLEKEGEREKAKSK